MNPNIISAPEGIETEFEPPVWVTVLVAVNVAVVLLKLWVEVVETIAVLIH
jgi:phosphate/sulfate permease